jgi:hypothetical protein
MNILEPDVFFSETQEALARALRLCQGCPLRAACLEHALVRPELFGIWGGMTVGQRIRLLPGGGQKRPRPGWRTSTEGRPQGSSRQVRKGTAEVAVTVTA